MWQSSSRIRRKNGENEEFHKEKAGGFCAAGAVAEFWVLRDDSVDRLRRQQWLRAGAVRCCVWPGVEHRDYNNGNISCSLLCFFVMVMAFTFAADALCVKARSFWPAVVLHASHNVFVQSIFDPITVTGRYTRFVTSEFGAGLALAYLAAALLLCAGMKNQQGKENPVKAVPHRTR